MPPYSKYMKDIVSNKRKIPNEEISTMLANYSFNGKIPKKFGDPGIPTIPCSIKNNSVRTALCDLGAGVSVMPFIFIRDSIYTSLFLLIFHYKWLTNLLLCQLVFVRMFPLNLLIV